MVCRQDEDVLASGTGDTERRLVRRVLAGDASAFLDLATRYHPSAVRVATAWGHDTERAEQIVRSAWRALLDQLAAGDDARPLATSFLRNVCELARASAPDPRRRPRDVATFTHDDAGRRSAAPRSASGEVSPTALRAAIAALPAHERVVITLRDIEGFDADAAAAVLGVTVVAQHRLLHGARTSVLRALLEASAEQDARMEAVG
jgi:RNA polymerase sigma-70 factor (ECF subfamily)